MFQPPPPASDPSSSEWITLQLRYRKSYTEVNIKALRKMKLKLSWTVKDAIAVIAEALSLPSPDKYRLFLPARISQGGEVTSFGSWLEMKATLSNYNHLKPMDIIELKSTPHMVQFAHWTDIPRKDLMPWQMPNKLEEVEVLTGCQTVQLDYQDALKDIIPSLPALIPVKKGEEYIFIRFHTKDKGKTLARQWVDVNRSLEELEIIPGSQILLTPLSLFMKRSADSIASPIKEGQLLKQSYKDSGLTNQKKRWFALEDNLLYYYTAKTASAPSGVIPIEYYSIGHIRTNQDNEEQGGLDGSSSGGSRSNRSSRTYFGSSGSLRMPRGMLFGGNSQTAEKLYVFELHINACNCFTPKMHGTYILSDENEALVREWMKVLRYKCANCSDKRVFEVALEKAIKNQNGGDIPYVVEKTVEYILARAMDVEGIFRKSGGLISIQKYREAFDLGEKPPLDECNDPHAIAGLLKLYLRTLPEPLVPFEFYPKFRIALEQMGPEDKLREFRALINALPKLNQRLLAYLCGFLAQVAQHSKNNLMGLSNLATVFGPNILSPKVQSPLELMEHTPIICGVFETMVAQESYLFVDVREKQEAETLAAENKEEIEEERRPAFTSGVVRTRRFSSFSMSDGESFLSRGRTGVHAVGTDVQALAVRAENLSAKLKEEIEARKKLEELVATLIN